MTREREKEFNAAALIRLTYQKRICGKMATVIIIIIITITWIKFSNMSGQYSSLYKSPNQNSISTPQREGFFFWLESLFVTKYRKSVVIKKNESRGWLTLLPKFKKLVIYFIGKNEIIKFQKKNLTDYWLTFELNIYPRGVQNYYMLLLTALLMTMMVVVIMVNILRDSSRRRF